MSSDPAKPTQPPYRLGELTTSELARWRGQLERVIEALEQLPEDDPDLPELRLALEDAKAEEERRAQLAAANGEPS